MFRKLVAAGALSVGMLGFGAVGQAVAGPDVNIGIGLGGGYYEPRPRYYREPPYYYDRGRISCRQGARIVASAGFRNVRPTDCNGSEYVYRGVRRGDLYRIEVRARSGAIRDVDRIRRGGWGYDDDYDDY